MKESKETKRLAGACEPRPKRPYQKPAVRFERVFEVQALTCGKVQTTQSACHSNRKTS
jgi:hypothetical protein